MKYILIILMVTSDHGLQKEVIEHETLLQCEQNRDRIATKYAKVYKLHVFDFQCVKK